MRKAKTTVDIMGNLELMSRDMSLPETVRAEAAKEFVRLKAKEQPVAAPAAPARLDISVADFVAALNAAEREIAAKEIVRPESRPEIASRPEPVGETRQFAADALKRERRAKAARVERERIERVRQAEASRPETVEEFQARRQQEQAREYRNGGWQLSRFNDPPGC